MAGDAYKEAIKNAQIIYDMFATSSNQLDSININLEKLNRTAETLPSAQNNDWNKLNEAFLSVF